jgi:hypothetical protein
MVYYFVPFIVNNSLHLFQVSNRHKSVTVQNRTNVYMNIFLSQRPRKSPPAVMSTSRETPCTPTHTHIHLSAIYQFISNASRMQDTQNQFLVQFTLRLGSFVAKKKLYTIRSALPWTVQHTLARNVQTNQSTPLRVLLLFVQIVTFLVLETNSQDQRWLDSCDVEGQEGRVSADRRSRSAHRRQLSRWTWERYKASNCGRL